MSADYTDDEFDKLTLEQLHQPVRADVAWLRMVYRHLKGHCPNEMHGNAEVYVHDMICKSAGIE